MLLFATSEISYYLHQTRSKLFSFEESDYLYHIIIYNTHAVIQTTQHVFPLQLVDYCGRYNKALYLECHQIV